MTDEQQIRDLIQRGALAVHDGDLATVLADHAPNIVMFDVPPPQRGVRGLDAYRDTWPGFSSGRGQGPCSRSTRWTSRPARTSRSPLRYCAAARPRTSSATPSTGCDSPSAC